MMMISILQLSTTTTSSTSTGRNNVVMILGCPDDDKIDEHLLTYYPFSYTSLKT
jgi:hypothetical protein